MEIARLALDYLRALVWPAVTLILGFVFRSELKALIARVRHADLPGGFALDMPQEISAAQELSIRVEGTPAPPQHKQSPSIPLTEANARMIQVGLRPSPSGLDMQYYRNLAMQDPNLALAGLRIEIDILARNLAKGFGVSVHDSDTGTRLLRKLREAGSITAEQLQLALKVMQLCNAAVHGVPVSQEQAESVIDIASVLAEQFLAWLSWGFSDGWKPSQQVSPNLTATS